ncbi:MAG: PHP domain-containing protein [Oscillospiraceae bacterium]|nr:PHP domain-containing protein [Oscillospiraceae bacterium]
MEKICDLHTHSNFSDGTLAPSEIIDLAIEAGLSAVALCDHNTVDGLLEFLYAAEGKEIEAIPGAEFSVDYNGTELHLLGLYILPEHYGEISEMMLGFIRRKEESNINLINALNKDGYMISYDEIKKKAPNAKINRAHIAAELMSKGYIKSIGQAFEKLLAKNGGYYVEPKKISVWEMIDHLKSIGAVPVLAHPFLNLSEEQLLEFLPEAKKAGLVGMECYYSLFDEKKTEKAIKIADSFGLKRSGGSDFHGSNKPDIILGFGKGNLKVPFECAVCLKP